MEKNKVIERFVSSDILLAITDKRSQFCLHLALMGREPGYARCRCLSSHMGPWTPRLPTSCRQPPLGRGRGSRDARGDGNRSRPAGMGLRWLVRGRMNRRRLCPSRYPSRRPSRCRLVPETMLMSHQLLGDPMQLASRFNLRVTVRQRLD
jgi:hypothetical protein